MQNYKLECRMARADDDRRAIAALIHKTDPYIYPGICRDPYDPEWVGFISRCMDDEDNLFSIDNLSVLLADGRIVGVACVIPCGKHLSLTERVSVPDGFDGNFEEVNDGYFLPLIEEAEEFEGYDVTNVCISEDMRGRGAGSALMRFVVGAYGADVMHIDVIASNTAAVRLYERCGFENSSEYMGFSGEERPVLCSHMIREATEGARV